MLPAQRYPLTIPEAVVYPTVQDSLSWRSPATWWRSGRRAGAASDVVILVFYTTIQAPALSVIGLLAGRQSRVLVICANAVPHERRPGDRAMLAWLLRSTSAILVHTVAEREALLKLTDRPIAVAPLPPHLPVTTRVAREPDRPPVRRLLFFGKVRHYKGVDVLLEALTLVSNVELHIVGEFYEDVTRLRALISRLALAERVHMSPGYVPAGRIAELFAGVDALVLPYRTATASQLVALAHAHGLPTVATRVGNFPETVRHEIDGLLCAPDNASDLARALRVLYEPGRLAHLRAGVRPAESETTWNRYLSTLDMLVGSANSA